MTSYGDGILPRDRRLSVHMASVTPARRRDRRHAFLGWAAAYVGVFAALGLVTILVHKIFSVLL